MGQNNQENKNDKYIWNEGDVKLISEEEFKKQVAEGKGVLYEFKGEFPCCNRSICHSCDKEDVKLAKQISFKILQFIKKEYFNTFFKIESIKPIIKNVFNSLVSLCKKILPEEVILTKQLYCAVYMSLIDLLEKDKDINLTKEEIETLIKSINKE